LSDNDFGLVGGANPTPEWLDPPIQPHECFLFSTRSIRNHAQFSGWAIFHHQTDHWVSRARSNQFVARPLIDPSSDNPLENQGLCFVAL
jgi:hypothetical protein